MGKYNAKDMTPQRKSKDDQFAVIAEEFETSLSPVSIGGRRPCNVRFADDIDLLGGSEEELQRLTERLEKTAAGYGMEISSDTSKFLVNSIKQSHAPIYG